jgi:hypothetical protein
MRSFAAACSAQGLVATQTGLNSLLKLSPFNREEGQLHSGQHHPQCFILSMFATKKPLETEGGQHLGTSQQLRLTKVDYQYSCSAAVHADDHPQPQSH